MRKLIAIVITLIFIFDSASYGLAGDSLRPALAFQKKQRSAKLKDSVELEFRNTIEEAVRQNRDGLLKNSPVDKRAGLIPEAIKDFCDIACDDLIMLLNFLNDGKITIKKYQAIEYFYGYSHLFLIVISSRGGKRYLVDTTFAQFFNEKERAVGEIGHPAVILEKAREKHPGWPQMAEELLEKGYIELDDDTLAMYSCFLSKADSFVDKPFRVNRLLKDKGMDRHYSAEELIDLMGPIMPPDSRKQEVQKIQLFSL